MAQKTISGLKKRLKDAKKQLKIAKRKERIRLMVSILSFRIAKVGLKSAKAFSDCYLSQYKRKVSLLENTLRTREKAMKSYQKYKQGKLTVRHAQFALLQYRYYQKELDRMG